MKIIEILIKKAARKYLIDQDKTKTIDNGMHFIAVNKISGSYCEFGVFQGRSFIEAFHVAKRYNLDMKFFAFDSFEGLPEIKDSDKKSFWNKGDYSCSLHNFKKNVVKNKVDWKKVITVKSWFNKLNFRMNNKVAFLHIDCDLYESTRDVFNYIKKYLQDGTIILFDDWYAMKGDKRFGERRAFEEFLSKSKFEADEMPSYGLQKMFVLRIEE